MITGKILFHTCMTVQGKEMCLFSMKVVITLLSSDLAILKINACHKQLVSNRTKYGMAIVKQQPFISRIAEVHSSFERSVMIIQKSYLI